MTAPAEAPPDAMSPPAAPLPPLLALVADDEEAPREQLVAALHKAWPGLRVETALNGVDAWDRYLEVEPDLCLLDIRMPGLSGIEVARRIAGRTPVVFVSAFGDHALAAFDAGAVDYVLKPVEPARLARALDRLRRRLGEPPAPGGSATTTATAIAAATASPTEPGPDAAAQALLERLAAEARRPAPLTVLQAAVGREVRLIQLDEVIYFESDARYTRVVTATGDALIRMPLKELLPQLDEHTFWQVHRSVIVNHRHVASAVRVDEGQMHLNLRGRAEKLPVSRHFQSLFKGQ